MGRESPQAREARFRAWWATLTPEERASEVRAGHVRLNLPDSAAKPEKRMKRTREAQERAKRNADLSAIRGEQFIHLPKHQRFGIELREVIARRDSAA